MSLLLQLLGVLLLLAIAPLTLWSERRVKAWTQLRRGPSLLLPYRDLRRLLAKRPLVPSGASPAYLALPWLALAAILGAALLLPLGDAQAGFGGGVALLAFGLLLAAHRFLLAFQAYDTGTPFGGLGSSRELFLGGVGEPVFLLVAADLYLLTGTAAVPAHPLSLVEPAAWLLVGALVILWIAEAARIPFDNPATHLELTMVHEAMILEASGWILALHEVASALKQTLLAALVILLLIPLPPDPGLRLALLSLLVVAASGTLALVEAATAKVRLFRATHLLFMAMFLAFLGGVVALVQGGFA